MTSAVLQRLVVRTDHVALQNRSGAVLPRLVAIQDHTSLQNGGRG